jgi:hypothetical protein
LDRNQNAIARRAVLCNGELRCLRHSDSKLRCGVHHSITSSTHLFDSFEGDFEYDDPASHRREGGSVRVHANTEARQQARDDLANFFASALKQKIRADFRKACCFAPGTLEP